MRGSIVKRQGKATKDGKPITLYYIVYQVGKRQKWEAVPERTRKAAEKLLARRLNEIGDGEYREPSRMTFAEFKDVWFEKCARGQMKPTSVSKYQNMFGAKIVPAIGQKELSRIDAEDIQGFKSALLAEGLAPKTAGQYLQIVRQVLGCAVDWGYIRHNPAKLVKDPRVPRREMDCLNPEECRAFLDHAPERWYPFFLTALTTGLRFNELLAMKWKNLDWGSMRYFVKETLTRKTKTTDRGFDAPKTESSVAPVDLTPRCLDALQVHRARQAQEKLRAGESYKDLGLIFATRDGAPVDEHAVSRAFLPILKAAGLRRIRFHDLRHTCASLLIHQGESPKYIQRQMRHASIQMTFDRYGHLFPEAGREAARRLDATLFGSGGRAEAGSAV